MPMCEKLCAPSMQIFLIISRTIFDINLKPLKKLKLKLKAALKI